LPISSYSLYFSYVIFVRYGKERRQQAEERNQNWLMTPTPPLSALIFDTAKSEFPGFWTKKATRPDFSGSKGFIAFDGLNLLPIRGECRNPRKAQNIRGNARGNVKGRFVGRFVAFGWSFRQAFCGSFHPGFRRFIGSFTLGRAFRRVFHGSSGVSWFVGRFSGRFIGRFVGRFLGSFMVRREFHRQMKRHR
jgi:hypothetical protein